MLNMLDRHFESKANIWVVPITTIPYTIGLFAIIHNSAYIPLHMAFAYWLMMSVVYGVTTFALIRYVVKRLWTRYNDKIQKDSSNDCERD